MSLSDSDATSSISGAWLLTGFKAESLREQEGVHERVANRLRVMAETLGG